MALVFFNSFYNKKSVKMKSITRKNDSILNHEIKYLKFNQNFQFQNRKSETRNAKS